MSDSFSPGDPMRPDGRPGAAPPPGLVPFPPPGGAHPVPPSAGRPLRTVAWGLLLAFFDVRIGSFDVLPDALGWLLVVLGVGRLPVLDAGERTARLARVARVGAGVAAVLALPELVGFRTTLEPGSAATGAVLALVVVVGLLFTVTGTALARTVTGLAAAGGDADAERTWRSVGTWFLATSLVADVLMLVAVASASDGGTGGVLPLALAAFVAGAVVTVVLTYRCFADAGRPWAVRGV